MDNSEILKAIDAQISRLQQARALLAGGTSNGTVNSQLVKRGGGRRKLSTQARARIAAAQKARWAKWKKTQKAA